MALRRSRSPAPDRDGLERAPQLVDHERGERFTVDVLGDDHERTPARATCSSAAQVLHRADLLLVDQDHGILEHTSMRSGSVTKWRQIPAVELHALDHFERVPSTSLLQR
jgi:hypothetical protein